MENKPVIVYRRTVTEGDKSAVWCYIPRECANTVNGVTQNRTYSNNAFDVHVGNVESLQNVTRRNVLSHYVHREDKNLTMPAEEYQAKYAELRAELENDDDDYQKWTSLDAEFAWRKFNETWQCVYNEEVDAKDVPFKIVDLGAAKIPPYTTPNFMLMGDKITETIGLYTYSPKKIELVEEIGNKYGFERVKHETWGNENTKGYKWSTDGDATFRFMKVNGGYVSDNLTEGLKLMKGVVGTATECMDAYNKHVATIEEFWAEHKAKLSEVLVSSQMSMGELIKEIDGIWNAVHKLDVKLKDSSEHRWACSRISDLKAKLVKESNKEGNSQ